MSDRPKPIPPEEWIVWPVSDSSVFLNRPPVRYEDEADDGDGADPLPEGEPLPDESPIR